MIESKFMSALRIELEKGFTNEGVVHELSWIPGVQTGGVLCVIAHKKGIDQEQKKTQTFSFPLVMGDVVRLPASNRQGR